MTSGGHQASLSLPTPSTEKVHVQLSKLVPACYHVKGPRPAPRPVEEWTAVRSGRGRQSPQNNQGQGRRRTNQQRGREARIPHRGVQVMVGGQPRPKSGSSECVWGKGRRRAECWGRAICFRVVLVDDVTVWPLSERCSASLSLPTVLCPSWLHGPQRWD